MIWCRLTGAVALSVTVAGAVMAQQAGAIEEKKGPELLTPARIDRLAEPARSTWKAYVARSDELHARDTAFMNAELRRIGQTRMTKASYRAPVFDLSQRPEHWYQSDSAKQIADAVLTFQTPSGGWSKRTDMTTPRAPGMSFYSETDTWHYAPTFDNGATSGQIKFLVQMAKATHNKRYAERSSRGAALVVAAQQPNGCWPQSYPLEGGYHDAATHNDDTTILLISLLNDVATSGVIAKDVQNGAKLASAKGLQCLLATQVVLDGTKTVWAQQHDPVTLEPAPARSYELAGLAGRESASIMNYLMSIESPSAEVVRAVHAAASWFRAHELSGMGYDPANGVTPDSNAKRTWARLTEMETGKPIFSNRDGVKLYDWNKLTDRRTGYAWFSNEPAGSLKRYDKWAQQHPLRERH